MTVDKTKLKARAEQLMSDHSGAEFDPIPAIPVAASDVLALLAEIDQLKGIQPGFPPRPPEGEGLPRYGLRWNGPQQPLATPMDDGYWTPWHLADQINSENERYRKYGCDTCDGSGHLHRADGEYFGECTSCGAYELEQSKRERDQLKAKLAEASGAERQGSMPSEATLIAAGFGYPMSKEDAVKAYKASLQPRTDHPSNEDCEWCHGCGHDYHGDPCVGCCKPASLPAPVERDERAEFEVWAAKNGIATTRTTQALGFANGQRRNAGDYILIESLCSHAAWMARASLDKVAHDAIPDDKKTGD